MDLQVERVDGRDRPEALEHVDQLDGALAGVHRTVAGPLGGAHGAKSPLVAHLRGVWSNPHVRRKAVRLPLVTVLVTKGSTGG